MYYTIENKIGAKITVGDKTFVCGQCYATKTKAPKDVDYLLAFSKAENPADGLVWRFDGKADIDYHRFCDEISDDLDTLLSLGWKTERINIQAKIRPSKDSKKAIAQAKRAEDIADIERQFAAGEIDAAEFGRLAMLLASTL